MSALPPSAAIVSAIEDALAPWNIRFDESPVLPELIFDRFYRVATDRGEIGAGLGLAIVRSICAAHGGRIVAESTLGGGSTFRMEIPRG